MVLVILGNNESDIGGIMTFRLNSTPKEEHSYIIPQGNQMRGFTFKLKEDTCLWYWKMCSKCGSIQFDKTELDIKQRKKIEVLRDQAWKAWIRIKENEAYEKENR